MMRRTELDALPRASTVFFFGVGPLEDHGPHLPLGLDVSEAAWMCRAAAERLEKEKPGWVGVLMPSVPLGIDSDTTELAITVRPHVLRDWLVDACASLRRAGFSHFVCFSGHVGPRQLTAIEEAGKLLNRGRLWRLLSGNGGPTHFVSATSALVPPAEIWRSPFWSDPAEHGGERDTSVALALGAVQTAQAPDVERPARRFDRWVARMRRTRSGHWGKPSKASAQAGARELEERLQDIFPKLRAVWEGTNPNLLFRSYYSVLPPNRSFFKAWLLFAAVLAVMLLWMFLTFPSMD
jgi:creatinine amidohydrolase/Fe(II)-dependent formamide hydrolase-like protein